VIPKRKPIPANRKARRAEGIRLIKPKRGGGSFGPSLLNALIATINDHDPDVVMSPGLMMGEKGWLFHAHGAFRYAVVAGKTRISLHAVALQVHPTLYAAYKKRISFGDVGKSNIRFKPDAKVDLAVMAAFIQDCAKAMAGG